jgi:hypothetical protein
MQKRLSTAGDGGPEYERRDEIYIKACGIASCETGVELHDLAMYTDWSMLQVDREVFPGARELN